MKQCCRVLFALFIVINFVACSTKFVAPQKDGPPLKQVNVNKIPNAVPKAEPLSRYGNPPNYRVFGKTYHVMRSAKDYKATGIASWYGTKFHARRTSSGEPYNMFAMTAAHKTLPIPSYVRVTNLKNGRQIIVKVNDRGPFHENRIIDLSYVAAKKLGITATGTGLVEVDVINPLADHKQPEKLLVNPSNKAKLYLQVGAFAERNNAQRLAQHITSLVKQPVHLTEGNYQQNPIYRVQIGPLANVELSDKIHEQLKKSGIGDVLAVVQ